VTPKKGERSLSSGTFIGPGLKGGRARRLAAGKAVDMAV